MARIQSISFESQSMWVPKIDVPSSNSVHGKLEFPVLMNVRFRRPHTPKQTICFRPAIARISQLTTQIKEWLGHE